MSFDPFGADQDALDFIVLAGVKSPGLALVDGAQSLRKWDEQQGYGSSGATLKWTGNGLGEFTVEFVLWTDGPNGHFAQWAASGLEELLKETPPGGPKPKAYDIVHPLLADVEIHAVVVLESNQWKPANDTGAWSKVVKFKKYKAPKPAIGKPDGAKDGPKDPATAKDAQDQAILDQEQKLKKLQEQDANTP